MTCLVNAYVITHGIQIFKSTETTMFYFYQPKIPTWGGTIFIQ